MKRYLKLVMAVLMTVMLFSVTALANETCDYAADGEECEIWYFFNKDTHWRACVNHDDEYGNDAAVSEEEAHEFEDGVCAICGMKETKGTPTTYYIIVFVVVGVIGLWASAKSRSTFKNSNLEHTPFGLDKFKKH